MHMFKNLWNFEKRKKKFKYQLINSFLIFKDPLHSRDFRK